MLDGLKSGFSEFEMKIRVGTAGGGSGQLFQTGGSLFTYFAPDYLTTGQGIVLGVSRQGGGPSVPQSSATIDIPVIGYSNSYSVASDLGSIESLCWLYGCRVITLPGGSFQLKWTSLEWYVNGVLKDTQGAATFTSGMAPTPSSIPLLGAGMWMAGSAAFGTAHVVACLGSAVQTDSSKDSTGTVFGGYETKLDGSWQSSPVSLMPTGIGGMVSGTNTNNVVLNVHSYQTVAAHQIDQYFRNVDVLIVPDEAHGIERMNDDYEELVFFGGHPKVTRTDQTNIRDRICLSDVETITSTSSSTEIYPARALTRATVTNSAHSIETPITQTKYSPINVTTFLRQMFPTHYTETANTSSWALDHAGILGTLKNYDAVNARFSEYLNTIGSPYASFAPEFPPDTSGYSWNLAGVPETIDYFANKVGQQHITFPSLTILENTKHRVNVVAEPLSQNGIAGNSLAMIGYATGYWGIDDFASSDVSGYPASITTTAASSSRWTFPSGTGAVGTDITLTTGTEVRFAMTDYAVVPIMYPTICNRVNLTWSTTNVTNIAVYARGQDGTDVLITNNVQGTFAIPIGASTQWVSSMGQDFGDPYIADTYSTPRVGDDTAAAMIDNTRMGTFVMMPSRSPYYLKFVVTATGTATIHHPIFYACSLTDAKVFHVTRRDNVICFKDGPAVSSGRLEFYDYGTDSVLTSPNPLDDPELTSTMGDGWSFENAFFNGVVSNTGLLTRLGNEFLINEEFPAGVLREAWGNVYSGVREPDTISFWANSTLGPRMCYYSSWREMPNVYFLPKKKRTSALGWNQDTTYGQYRYALTTNKHSIIVPGTLQPKLINSSVDVLTPATSPTGWSVSTYTPVVDSSEGYDWELWWDNKKWLQMRPWRGNFNVFGIPTGDTGYPQWIVQDEQGRLHNAYVKAADVWYRRSDDTRSAGGWRIDVQVTSSANVIRCAFDYDQIYRRFELYYETTGHDVYYTYSKGDEGATWATPALVGHNMVNFTTATNHFNGDRIRVWFEWDSGTSGPGKAKGQYRRFADSAWSSTFTFTSSASAISVADNGMCNVAFAYSNQGELTWEPLINGDTDPSTWYSNDEGRNWKRE